MGTFRFSADMNVRCDVVDKQRNAKPASRPMVGGTTAYDPSPMSMAGIINDQTDAATITPEANPSRTFCINAGISRFIRNTKAAPKVVPRNGIRSVAKTGYMISFFKGFVNAKVQSLSHFVNHNL